MKLYVDLETLQLIEGPGFRSQVSAIRFKRGDACPIELSFLQDGTTRVHIGDPSQLNIQFGLKPRSRYDVSYLVSTTDWQMPDLIDTTPVYLCQANFNTTELDSAIGVGRTTGSELDENLIPTTQHFLVRAPGKAGAATSRSFPSTTRLPVLTASSQGRLAVQAFQSSDSPKPVLVPGNLCNSTSTRHPSFGSAAMRRRSTMTTRPVLPRWSFPPQPTG